MALFEGFKSVVALAGGVGGARFAHGLQQILPLGALTVIGNTGDDFRRYGLAISPDLDTVLYNLAGLAHPVNGWGLEGDTLNMLGMVRRYGDDAWFGLADKDLATHLLRTQWLAEGHTLTQITARLSTALNIPSRILPMSDAPAPTMIDTVEHGVIPFQEYFVRYGWQPTVREVLIPKAVPGTEAVHAALEDADLILICPSNPVLSVLPILNVDGVRGRLEARRVPSLVVSPIIGGQAVKGPAVKLMRELGMEASAQGVADYYGALIDGIVIADIDTVHGPAALKTDIFMRDGDDRARLAKEVLTWAEAIY